jgi:Terminase large subunit, T4likevirus-type, N-terminal
LTDRLSASRDLALAREYEKRFGKPVTALDFATQCGFAPDPWQAKVLEWKGQRLLLNCSRQAGKSTTTAILALHRAVTVAKSLVLLISPSLRQSGELFLKVKESYLALANKPALDQDNKLSMRLANGSRIVSLPSSEDTIRGYSSVSLIIEDESAFVDDGLNIAVRPMLAVSGGQLVMMTTPKGRRGHFFEAWERGGDAYDRIRVTAREIPRYAPDFIEAERAELYRRGLGDLFRQEYEGEFVDAAAGRVYGSFDEQRATIDRLPGDSRTEWNYVLGLDFGVIDENALTVLAWREHDPCVYVVKSYRKSGLPTDMAAEVIALGATYSFSQIVGDEGGMGKAFAEDMRTRFSIPVMRADKANKAGNIALINGELASGRVKVIARECPDLVAEWLELPWAEGAKKEADGFKNHCADSALYGWRACPNYHERVEAPRPRAGTPDFYASEHARLLALDIEQSERDAAEREREEREERMFG